MIAIILAAATNTRLEEEIAASLDPAIAKLCGLPKSMLPVGNEGKSMLEHWLALIDKNREISHVFIVTCAAKYKHFERFATARGIPVEFVVNDGVTHHDDRLGSARDLWLGLKRAGQVLKTMDHHVVVIAGDCLFYKTFDVRGVVNFFKRRKENNSVVLYHNLNPQMSSVEERGMVVVNPKTKSIVAFREKPSQEEWRLAKLAAFDLDASDTATADKIADLTSPMFYIFRSADIPLVENFVNENIHFGASHMGCGKLVEYMSQETTFIGIRLPSAFALIGKNAGLADYCALNEQFSGKPGSTPSSFDGRDQVTKSAYARVGLMGNPSDGYFGKTLGLSIANFWATVKLEASPTLKLIPNMLYDPSEFGSLGGLHEIGRREGYQGGMRLLMATCKKFSEYCLDHGIALPNKNFSVSYDTNIPRQVGLAGSSAIVTALFKALMEFYGLTDADIPKQLQPGFVLSVETEELGINAGLQDRVVQVYDGLTYMDFDEAYMKEHGHGLYRSVDRGMINNLPFFLAYENDPSDSGKIHSTVRQKWLDGDERVRDGMRRFGDLTDEAINAMMEKDAAKLMDLMNANFDCRRDIFGDPCLGQANLRMIAIGRKHGAAVKFSGSGGAVVGLCSPDKIAHLRSEYEGNGFIFTELKPHFPGFNSPVKDPAPSSAYPSSPGSITPQSPSSLENLEGNRIVNTSPARSSPGPVFFPSN